MVVWAVRQWLCFSFLNKPTFGKNRAPVAAMLQGSLLLGMAGGKEIA
jgi:hypothetical protein